MPTQDKVETIEDLKSRLDGVKTVLLAEYRGLTVSQLSDLRKQLKAVSAEYKIVKNRLARLAIASSSLAGLSPALTGPTGLVLAKGDPVSVAKTLQTFARTNQALVLKVGMVEGQMLEPAGLKALADLPSRDALRAADRRRPAGTAHPAGGPAAGAPARARVRPGAAGDIRPRRRVTTTHRGTRVTWPMSNRSPRNSTS